MVKTVDTSSLQRVPTCDARFESSPELYSLKKSAGSDRMRIIVAASTEMFNLVSMRAVILFLTAVISMVLIETHTEKTAMAASSRTLFDSSTLPNKSLFNIGLIMPTSERKSVAAAIITRSAAEKVCAMYLTKAGMLIFFSGKGL